MSAGPRAGAGLAAVGIALLALAPGCAPRRDPIAWHLWRDTYPPEVAVPLAGKARRLEEHLVRRHLAPEGVLVYRRPDTPFDPARPDAYANLSDTPIWTGVLAAAWAFEYSVTGRPEDRERLVRALEGLRFLQEVTGKPGLLARAVFPAAHPIPGGPDAGEWRDAPPPHSAWRYRGDVSKDQYFGVLFGYAALCAELGVAAGRGDPGLRGLAAPAAAAIADHLWRHGFRIVDADGETTSFGAVPGFLLGCIPIGPNAGLVLGFQKVAARLTGEPRFRERYEELVRREWPKALNVVKVAGFGWANHNNDNMGFMALYALTRLEEDPETLGIYDRALARLWRLVEHEGNAFWHAVYAGRHPLPRRARFDLRENLRVWPLDPVVYSYDATRHPAADPAFFEDRFDRPQNRTALPIHFRRRGDFAWKNSPYALRVEEPRSGEVTGSQVGYLLAYWMCRGILGDPESLVEPATARRIRRGKGVPPDAAP